jgi:predicted nucleic acid-binding Zn ribbon protein
VKQCVICGAAVRRCNKKANTCSPVCTRARNARRSREAQVIADIKFMEEQERIDQELYEVLRRTER